MKSTHHASRFFAPLALSLVVSVSAPALAQDDDEPAAPRARPKAAEAEPKGPAPKLDLRLEEPAVRSVLGANPTTPKEIVRAIDVLIDLGRPELARPLLAQLLEAKPDAKTLVTLAHDFGSATFIKLAGNPSLAPQGGQLADAVLSAAQDARNDPALLSKLVADLSADDELRAPGRDPRLEKSARGRRRTLGAALTAPGQPRRQQALRDMLVRLGADAVGPLTAMLDAPDPAAKTQAAMVLGRLKAKAALPALLALALTPSSSADLKAAADRALVEVVGRVPTSAEAQDLFTHAARAALLQARLLRADPQPSAQHWSWDQKLGQSVLGELPPADAAAIDAAQLAGNAYRLKADAPNRQLFLLAQLTAAKLLGGLDRPLATGEGTVGLKWLRWGRQQLKRRSRKPWPRAS